MTTAYHPQADGQTERMNRTLEYMLRHYIGPTLDDWDQKLALAEFAMNNGRSATTGFSPFYLNYGLHPRSAVTREFIRQHKGAVPTAEEFALQMDQDVVQAKKAIEAAQQRQNAQYDKHRRLVEYAAGQRVMLSTANLKLKNPGAKKLLPKWIGPFEIMELVGKAAVRLALPPTYKVHPVFHISIVKPFLAGQRPLLPPPVDHFEGDDYYKVECIVGHRPEASARAEVEKKGAYLVKWQGYGAEHNSWEPHKNFADSLAQDQYWEYLDKVQVKPKPT